MVNYDEEERDIIAAFEAGELRSLNPSREELERHRAYARHTMSKSKRVNIRLSAKDLDGIKIRALEEGIPYQTLMGSILHKYVSGRLVEGASA
ncbi:MAG: antitoxin [Chloroflexi bacterium]|nr:antitoxin [Chloroflexota bacterium]